MLMEEWFTHEGRRLGLERRGEGRNMGEERKGDEWSRVMEWRREKRQEGRKGKRRGKEMSGEEEWNGERKERKVK